MDKPCDDVVKVYDYNRIYRIGLIHGMLMSGKDHKEISKYLGIPYLSVCHLDKCDDYPEVEYVARR